MENTNLNNYDKNYYEVIFSNNWESNKNKEYFEYRKQWSENSKNKIIAKVPLHLDIETTDLCNLKCPMCARTVALENKVNKNQGYMSKDDFRKIIDQAKELGVYSVKLNYIGEPLLHKDLIWQIDYAKKAGIIDVMLNTNGLLLTKELSEQILKAGLDKIMFSLDAISPDLYEKIRVGSNLGKVIDNIFNFCKLRNESYPDTQIKLTMLMYEGNDEFKFQFEAMKIMWKNLVDAISYGYCVEKDLTKQQKLIKNPNFCCEQLFQRLVLKYNGHVVPCCLDEYNQYSLGNWRTELLKNIWNNEKQTFIREKHLTGNYDHIEMCSKCYLSTL